MKVRIANPLYDTVFKLLMENLTIARQFLSLLLDAEITELSIQPQEQTHFAKASSVLSRESYVRVYRVDFNATVRFPDGQRRVLIELQKAISGKVVGRFRRYLGVYYGVAPQEAGHLPIIAVYLLGFRLPTPLPTVIKVRRQYLNGSTGELLEGVREPFIECLTHDAVLVQVPLIDSKIPPSNELEQVLQIFDQHHQEGKEAEEDAYRRTLVVDDALGERHPLLEKMLRLLVYAAADDETREQMELEEEASGLEDELDEALKREAEERVQKEAALAQKEATIRENEVLLKELAAMREHMAQLNKGN